MKKLNIALAALLLGGVPGLAESSGGILDGISRANDVVNGIVWGAPALVLLSFAGVLLTVLIRVFQLTHIPHWMRNTIGAVFLDKHVTRNTDEKSISQFQSLCTALAGTVGTGNIVGVAGAIMTGGPGAVFWMWIIAFFGMAVKYSENVLGIYYRRRNSDGEWSGGAMYYLRDGLGAFKGCQGLGKVLAWLFALFCLIASFGIGNMTQVNSISGNLAVSFGIPTWVTGIIVVILVGLVVVGGLRRIASVTEKIVPFMVILYVIGSIIILFTHIERIGAVFADTIVVCTLTAFTVLSSDLIDLSTGAVVESWNGITLTKANLVNTAFAMRFGFLGSAFIAISITLFAFSTVLGWVHYGTKSTEYLLGEKNTIPYRMLYVLLTFGGAVMGDNLAWNLADTFNGLMMIPNLIGVIALSGTVARITKNYLDRNFHGSMAKPMLSAFADER